MANKVKIPEQLLTEVTRALYDAHWRLPIVTDLSHDMLRLAGELHEILDKPIPRRPALRHPTLLERVSHLQAHGWRYHGGQFYLQLVSTPRSLREAEQITLKARRLETPQPDTHTPSQP